MLAREGLDPTRFLMQATIPDLAFFLVKATISGLTDQALAAVADEVAARHLMLLLQLLLLRRCCQTRVPE